MLFVALLIKLDSPGPVFYRQQLVGRHGKPFMMVKFRSRKVDIGPQSDQPAAQTRVGGFIRPMRIDELPQFINVLRGEMSMIGPRPERPRFVDQVTERIPLYRERLRVKPGITGWAQVNYQYGASLEEAKKKLSYDLDYVKRRSFWLDIRILLLSVWIILSRRGNP